MVQLHLEIRCLKLHLSQSDFITLRSPKPALPQLFFSKCHHHALKLRHQVGTLIFTHLSSISLQPPGLMILSSNYALLSILLASAKRISHWSWQLGNCGWPWKNIFQRNSWGKNLDYGELKNGWEMRDGINMSWHLFQEIWLYKGFL